MGKYYLIVWVHLNERKTRLDKKLKAISSSEQKCRKNGVIGLYQADFSNFIEHLVFEAGRGTDALN